MHLCSRLYACWGKYKEPVKWHQVSAPEAMEGDVQGAESSRKGVCGTGEGGFRSHGSQDCCVWLLKSKPQPRASFMVALTYFQWCCGRSTYFSREMSCKYNTNGRGRHLWFFPHRRKPCFFILWSDTEILSSEQRYGIDTGSSAGPRT